MYKSVKHAVGHYCAAVKGPKLAQGELIRVQESNAPNEHWITIGAAIHSPDGLGVPHGDPALDRMLEWATQTDGEIDGGPLVGRLAGLLRSWGMLEEPITPEPVETRACVDLYTGETFYLTSRK